MRTRLQWHSACAPMHAGMCTHNTCLYMQPRALQNKKASTQTQATHAGTLMHVHRRSICTCWCDTTACSAKRYRHIQAASCAGVVWVLHLICECLESKSPLGISVIRIVCICLQPVRTIWIPARAYEFFRRVQFVGYCIKVSLLQIAGETACTGAPDSTRTFKYF